MDIILKKSRRLAWLDILKGIGIIFVVVGHVYSNKIIFNWIYSFHMPLFFLAAGWVYKEKSILMDIKRRIQTIVIPYFSYGILILIYWQFFERRFRDADRSFIDSMLGLILGQYNYLDFNVHLWFLPCFFMTVVLFNIFVNIGGKRNAYVISAIMSVFWLIVSLPELPWGGNRVFRYIIFYAIGTYGASKSSSTLSICKKSYIKGILAIGFIMVNFVLAYVYMTTGIMYFITALVGVEGIVLLSRFINKNNVLQYFGRISLIVLCIHGPVYRIVVKIISMLFHMNTEAVRKNFVLSMITANDPVTGPTTPPLP